MKEEIGKVLKRSGLEEEAEMVIGALWELQTGRAIWRTVREAEKQCGWALWMDARGGEGGRRRGRSWEKGRRRERICIRAYVGMYVCSLLNVSTFVGV